MPRHYSNLGGAFYVIQWARLDTVAVGQAWISAARTRRDTNVHGGRSAVGNKSRILAVDPVCGVPDPRKRIVADHSEVGWQCMSSAV